MFCHGRNQAQSDAADQFRLAIIQLDEEAERSLLGVDLHEEWHSGPCCGGALARKGGAVCKATDELHQTGLGDGDEAGTIALWVIRRSQTVGLSFGRV